MQHEHEALIRRFYEAFAARDHATMAACYHPEATFGDPVFPDLEGSAIGDMWRMLCTRGKDLELSFDGIEADERQGRAHWEAHYTFAATKRHVHNRIDAEFTFRDGLIASHRDRFDLWAWTRMALGPAGVLLGWTPIVQGRVRSQAADQLERFRASSA